MALNFPPVSAGDGNPTNGMIWTSPEGRQWKYDSTIPGWRSLAPTGNSNIVYRGGLDLTENPNIQYNDIEAGNEFAVVVGADPVDGTLYPGLGGQTVLEGAIARYDGNEWQVIGFVPYATEDVPGIVELADENEAIADPLNNRVVMTPERTGELIDVKVPQAATNIVGKTRYATKNEAEAGVETEAALTPASIRDLVNQILENEKNIVPTGMIAWFPTRREQDVPRGWLVCDGSRIYNKDDTVDLYNALRNWGNPWGNSPSSDVVRLPDLRGRFIRGYYFETDRDPDRAAYGQPVNDTFGSHTHGVIDSGHNHLYEGRDEGQDDKNSSQTLMSEGWKGDPVVKRTEDSNAGISISPAGHSETKPKNISLTPVIKL